MLGLPSTPVNELQQRQLDFSVLIRTAEKFSEETGVSIETVWRWRDRGWLKSHNISGRPYILTEEIHNFLNRVKAGEFAVEVVPVQERLKKSREPKAA